MTEVPAETPYTLPVAEATVATEVPVLLLLAAGAVSQRRRGRRTYRGCAGDGRWQRIYRHHGRDTAAGAQRVGDRGRTGYNTANSAAAAAHRGRSSSATLAQVPPPVRSVRPVVVPQHIRAAMPEMIPGELLTVIAFVALRTSHLWYNWIVVVPANTPCTMPLAVTVATKVSCCVARKAAAGGGSAQSNRKAHADGGTAGERGCGTYR